MNYRKAIAVVFMGIATILGIWFYTKIQYPDNLLDYFRKEYYGQFGALAICIELGIAGFYLMVKHSKANFALALFSFTTLLDVVFNLIGLFNSNIPIFASVLFVLCALLALWIAFSNAFSLGRIKTFAICISFILGNAVELFFNYL